MKRPWYQLETSEVVDLLGSDPVSGLPSIEAQRRLNEIGRNEISSTEHRSPLAILLAQLKSSLIFLLVAAMFISLLLGEISDAVAILVIILLNTALGFWQDYQAERSLAKLKKLAMPTVIVHRDGNSEDIAVAELVPGDVVTLQAGYFVPADCRLLETTDLAIDESALTGESFPVEKAIDSLSEKRLAIGDQLNMAFKGTMIARGTARAVVTGSGMNTELGKIAGSLMEVQSEPTPLQNRLKRLSRNLAVIAILVVALVFLAGMFAGQSARLMLMTALSMAVALVPEGLPAVATVALAIGARRMYKRNALIRQLPAVETLGSVSVICSDKTGTLTQNRMTATDLDVADCQIQDDPSAASSATSQNRSIHLLLLLACLCNDAELKIETELAIDGGLPREPSDGPTAVGEPTEKALVEVAARFGLDQHALKKIFPRIGEVAFDSNRKRMTTLHEIRSPVNDAPESWERSNLEAFDPAWYGLDRSLAQVAFIKGAVESVLSVSNYVWVDQQPVPLNSEWQERIERRRDELSSLGTRVLGFGLRPVDGDIPLSDLETDLIFVGMIGLTDPARPEVKFAVSLCRRAGIRPIMITGDHPLTAQTVARTLGISDGRSAITGLELAEMPLDVLQKEVREASVFARVAPTDKLRIVESLQKNNEVVAMTGDGVNDAPALKQANIGIAMGGTGTDVSKEAAEMVLLDDNFATIVSAVEQGRIVYDNVKKFVKYTMSSNIGEVLVMTLGVICGLPLPLLPLQILWINLVTDGLPGLALATEPAENNTMNRRPIHFDEPIFDRRMKWELLWIGLLIGLVSLACGSLLSNHVTRVEHWRTVIFTVLTFSQMANVFACRSSDSILESGAKRLFRLLSGQPLGGGSEPDSRPRGTNGWLWAAVGATLCLQIVVIYSPFFHGIFQTQSLSSFELFACFAVSGLVFVLIDIQKLVLGNRMQSAANLT